jgi:hypothetical protein
MILTRKSNYKLDTLLVTHHSSFFIRLFSISADRIELRIRVAVLEEFLSPLFKWYFSYVSGLYFHSIN